MIKTAGSITKQNNGFEVEDVLLTYSEEEKQQNEINKANAKLVFNWNYLTIPREVFELGLSGNDAIVFSFIHSFCGHTGDRFYFTNDHLSTMFNLSERSITNILKKLHDSKLISMSYRRKADGGQIRFINIPTRKKFQYQLEKIASSKTQKVRGKNNKINDNKINKGFLKNPITQDEDFKKLQDIKGSDYLREVSLHDALNARYPVWKYGAEWKDARKELNQI